MASSGILTAARTALTICRELTSRTPDGDMLAQWPGWGVAAPAFDPRPVGPWEDLAAEFRDTLTDDAYQSAKMSLDTSFYTPAGIVERTWNLITGAGFTGGRVFYPGVGAAAFLNGAPALPLDVVGVEVDHTTAAVAAQLHPSMTLHTAPLDEVTVPTGGFDLAIGNVPFSAASVYDRARRTSSSLHQYFLDRAIDAVRPGGYVAMITSLSTMDSAAMVDLLDRAELTAAVRLPSSTFRGTGAAADLLLLQRRATDLDPDLVLWPRDDFPGVYPRVQVARYWADHPDQVGGTIEPSTNPTGPRLTVKAAPVASPVLDAAFADAAATMKPFASDRPADALDDVIVADPAGRKEGSFHLVDGACVKVTGGTLEPVAKPTGELLALIELRDLTCTLMDAEADHTTADANLTPIRDALRDAYRAYVHRYGPINRGHFSEGKVDPETGQPALSWRPARCGGFRRDPDAPLVAALEVYEPETNTATEAPILHRRVNRPYTPPTSAETAAEALAISLSETGHINPDRIASLLGCTVEQALHRLGDRVFYDPEQQHWCRANDYLCGNIPDRLAAARAAAEDDPTLQRNVAALESVLPERLGPTDIYPTLGVTWVQTEDIAQFTSDVLGRHAPVEYCAATGDWHVEPPYQMPPAAITTYGSPDMNGYQLLHHALNGKPVVVYDTDPRRGKVRNHPKTVAAQTHLHALNTAFAEWLWSDTERAERVLDEYNRRFTAHLPRISDGSHLTLPDLDPNVVTPYPWQYNAVDRVVSSPATLCAHPVGSGKTLSAIASAITLRRFGLATKPLVVVPNHLLEQVAREARQAFPAAQFLIATKDDLAGPARRLFAARCATGDWDAVIMTHASFGAIPLTPRSERDWLNAQVDELDAILRTSNDYFNSKEIARRLRSFHARLDKLRDQQTDPNTIYFEQLGIDHLGIDEAHLYKRLSTPSMALARTGFTFGVSKRATDLKIKIDLLARRDPHRPHVAFYTGSTWSNTMAESYVWQTYLAEDRLADAGLTNFAAWSAQFVTFAARIEPSPDGATFRTAVRPYEVKNAPELRAMFAEFADVLTEEDIPLERPTKRAHTITVEPGPATRAYVQELVARAAAIHNGTAARDDCMLNICTAGRTIALDPQLLGLDEASPKVAAIADNVATIYRRHRNRTLPGTDRPGVCQLVFCDQGVPHPDDARTYGRLRRAMIDRGIPAAQIRFIHEARDDKAKEALFSACRAGDVAVLIASTGKAGLGTNIQRRLAAVHHADPDWVPTNMDQRNGRALRPGNLCDTVDVYSYVTEGTFDAFMFAALARKSHFIQQMLNGDPTLRHFTDIGEVELDYAEITALASGNPLLRRHTEATENVRRLRILRGMATRTLNTARTAHTEAQQRHEQAQTLHSIVVRRLADITPADATDTDTLAAMAKTFPRRTCCHWRGLTIDLAAKTRGARLQILGGLDGLAHFDITRSQATNPDALHDILTDWIDHTDDHLANCQRLIDEAARDQTEAEHLVNTWTFPQQDELAAAELDLATIEAEMQATLTTAA